MKATSPYLNLPLRSLAEIRSEAVRHLPEQAEPFLLGADEVCISSATRKRRWRKKVAIWAVALAFLVLGVTVGPYAALYFQMAVTALQNH